MCYNQDVVMQWSIEYIVTKHSGSIFLRGFPLTRDESFYQRKLRCFCHEEVNRRTQDGEIELKNLYGHKIQRIQF